RPDAAALSAAAHARAHDGDEDRGRERPPIRRTLFAPHPAEGVAHAPRADVVAWRDEPQPRAETWHRVDFIRLAATAGNEVCRQRHESAVRIRRSPAFIQV